MKNGFTKIPNSILDLPWANNPVVVFLYTWLSLHADKSGVVRMSLNDISSQTGLNKMQVRRALEKLRVTQVVTQVATQPATQLPNVITICFLSGCKPKNIQSDIASDIGSDIGSDTPRAYKNDNIISCLNEDDNKKIDSSLRSESTHTNSARNEFIKWLMMKCPYIFRHYDLPSESEFDKLKAKYGSEAIADECMNIENRVDLRKKYSNLYTTLLNWLKRNNHGTTQTNQGPGQGPEHPSDGELREQSIRIMQRRRAKREAGQGAVRDGGLFPDEGQS